MISVDDAIFLAALPHRPGFFAAGGWKNFPAPGSAAFDDALRHSFSQIDLDFARKEAKQGLEFVRKRGLRFGFITSWDDSFPVLLREIFDSPPVLFYSGDRPPVFDASALAMVGTREPAPIALLAVDEFMAGERPSCVVSGLARGVDGRAHRAALRAGIPGLAVLGAGLGYAGPRENMDIPGRAARDGIPFHLISEFPPHFPGRREYFPRRNRIIAGLVQEVILIQAPFKSGAMITARYAMEEGRDLRVFDHELLSAGGRNAGARSLLADGADLLRVPGLEQKISLKPEFKKEPGAEQLEFWTKELDGELKWLGGEYYFEGKR